MEACPTAPAPADTITRLLLNAAGTLAAAAVTNTPRLDAEVLLAAACGQNRTALWVRGGEPVPETCKVVFQSMLNRRLGGEPAQYIVERQEFWSLDFVVTPAVLIPRPET